MSTSNSPCAACKCRRQKCTQECVYAPFFPADQPQRFINVHKVFGASNVAKLLNELPVSQREDAVNSLAYEAAYRLHDPVYGCVGLISFLQQRLKQLQFDLINARKELASLINQQNPNNHSSAAVKIPFNMQQMMGLPQVPVVAPPHGGQVIVVDPQQMIETQQLMFNYDQREQAEQLMRFNNGGFDGVTAAEYNQMVSTTSLSPIMGTYESASYDQLKQKQQQPEHDTLHSDELQLRSQMVVHQQNRQQEPPVQAKSVDARNVCP